MEQADKYVESVLSRFNFENERTKLKMKESIINITRGFLGEIRASFYTDTTRTITIKNRDTKEKETKEVTIYNAIPKKFHNYIFSRYLKIITAVEITIYIVYQDVSRVDWGFLKDEFRTKNEEFNHQYFAFDLCRALNLSYIDFLYFLFDKSNFRISNIRMASENERNKIVANMTESIAFGVRKEADLMRNQLSQSTGIWHFLSLFEYDELFLKIELDSKIPYEYTVNFLDALENISRIIRAREKMLELKELYEETRNAQVQHSYGIEYQRMYDLSYNFIKNNFNYMLQESQALGMGEDITNEKGAFEMLCEYYFNRIPNLSSYDYASIKFPLNELLGLKRDDEFEEKGGFSMVYVNDINTTINQISELNKFTKELLGESQKLIPHSELDWGETVLEFETQSDSSKSKKVEKTFIIEKLNSPYSMKEGRAVGHCGNQPRGGSHDVIYSLRRRYATTTRGKKQVGYTVHATITVDQFGIVREAKGQNNSKPKIEYWKYIASLYHEEKSIQLGVGSLGHWPSDISSEDFSIAEALEAGVCTREDFSDRPYIFNHVDYLEHIGVAKYLVVSKENTIDAIFEMDLVSDFSKAVKLGIFSKDDLETVVDLVFKEVFGEKDEIITGGKKTGILSPLSFSNKNNVLNLFNLFEKNSESVGILPKEQALSLLSREINRQSLVKEMNNAQYVLANTDNEEISNMFNQKIKTYLANEFEIYPVIPTYITLSLFFKNQFEGFVHLLEVWDKFHDNNELIQKFSELILVYLKNNYPKYYTGEYATSKNFFTTNYYEKDKLNLLCSNIVLLKMETNDKEIKHHKRNIYEIAYDFELNTKGILPAKNKNDEHLLFMKELCREAFSKVWFNLHSVQIALDVGITKMTNHLFIQKTDYGFTPNYEHDKSITTLVEFTSIGREGYGQIASKDLDIRRASLKGVKKRMIRRFFRQGYDTRTGVLKKLGDNFEVLEKNIKTNQMDLIFNKLGETSPEIYEHYKSRRKSSGGFVGNHYKNVNTVIWLAVIMTYYSKTMVETYNLFLEYLLSLFSTKIVDNEYNDSKVVKIKIKNDLFFEALFVVKNGFLNIINSVHANDLELNEDNFMSTVEATDMKLYANSLDNFAGELAYFYESKRGSSSSFNGGVFNYLSNAFEKSPLLFDKQETLDIIKNNKSIVENLKDFEIIDYVDYELLMVAYEYYNDYYKDK